MIVKKFSEKDYEAFKVLALGNRDDFSLKRILGLSNLTAINQRDVEVQKTIMESVTK